MTFQNKSRLRKIIEREERIIFNKVSLLLGYTISIVEEKILSINFRFSTWQQKKSKVRRDLRLSESTLDIMNEQSRILKSHGDSRRQLKVFL